MVEREGGLCGGDQQGAADADDGHPGKAHREGVSGDQDHDAECKNAACDQERDAPTEPPHQTRADQGADHGARGHRRPMQPSLGLRDPHLAGQQRHTGGEAVQQPAPRDEVGVQRDGDPVAVQADRGERCHGRAVVRQRSLVPS